MLIMDKEKYQVIIDEEPITVEPVVEGGEEVHVNPRVESDKKPSRKTRRRGTRGGRKARDNKAAEARRAAKNPEELPEGDNENPEPLSVAQAELDDAYGENPGEDGDSFEPTRDKDGPKEISDGQPKSSQDEPKIKKPSRQAPTKTEKTQPEKLEEKETLAKRVWNYGKPETAWVDGVVYRHGKKIAQKAKQRFDDHASSSATKPSRKKAGLFSKLKETYSAPSSDDLASGNKNNVGGDDSEASYLYIPDNVLTPEQKAKKDAVLADFKTQNTNPDGSNKNNVGDKTHNFISDSKTNGTAEEWLATASKDDMRFRLAEMQNSKRWGLVYGIRNRKDMIKLREAYDAKVREEINQSLKEEISSGTLDGSKYQDVAKRKIELMSVEAGLFFAAMATPNDVGTKYGQAVRRVGDVLYGKDRKTWRRIVVSAGIGVAAVGATAVAPVGAAIAVPAIRLLKIGASGIAGHDSAKGTERVFSKLQQKGDKLLDDVKVATADLQQGNPEELERLQLAQEGDFSQAYLERVNKSDTKRRVASFAGQAIGAAGIFGAGRLLADTISGKSASNPPTDTGVRDEIKERITRGRTHSPAGPRVSDHTDRIPTTPSGHAETYAQLTPKQRVDYETFRAAGASKQDTLHALNNPRQFEQLIHGADEIKRTTGLRGEALNQRIGKTLELAQAQKDYVNKVAKDGVAKAIAEHQFSANFKNLVNNDHFFSTVKQFRQQGFVGDALRRRVEGSLALAQAKNDFIVNRSGVTDINSLDHAVHEQYAREFDENFRRFVETTR